MTMTDLIEKIQECDYEVPNGLKQFLQNGYFYGYEKDDGEYIEHDITDQVFDFIHALIRNRLKPDLFTMRYIKGAIEEAINMNGAYEIYSPHSIDHNPHDIVLELPQEN